MSWTDRAILLTVAKVAKQTLVLEVLTENYGRCRAIASLDGSEAPVLLPGSFLRIHCTGDGLGQPMQAKLLEISGGIIAETPDDIGIVALSCTKDLMAMFLEVEDPVPEIYDATRTMMQSLVAGDDRWPVHYALVEFAILTELGHITGMSECMPAFRHGDAIYLSPKTARAVPRERAGAFLDRLIPVPGLLLGQRNASIIEVRQALDLTEMVLQRFALPSSESNALPVGRQDLIQALNIMEQIPKASVVAPISLEDEQLRRRRLMESKPLMVASRGAGAG